MTAWGLPKPRQVSPLNVQRRGATGRSGASAMAPGSRRSVERSGGGGAGRGGGGSAGPKPRQIRSGELFGGTREVVIEHEGDCYRLRCTSKGKLILTK
ncbi:MAG: hemin uptake protein HemP [Kiloniellales bacterium]